MILALWWACVGGISLTDAEKDEVRALSAAARAFNEPLEATRKAALLGALGRFGGRPDLGRCPVAIARPVEGDVGSFADQGVTFALSTAPVSVVHAKDLAASEGPRWDRVQNAIVNDVDAMLIGAYRAEDYTEVAAKLEKARSLATVEWIPADATLIIDRYLPPVIEGSSFTSGRVEGRMYVWDYRRAAIVCAADVFAVNSDTLGVHLHLNDDGQMVGARSDAERDLFRRAVWDGLDKLAVAGPPLMLIGG